MLARYLIASAAVILFSPAVRAEPAKGAVRGVVSEKHLGPLAGATVIITTALDRSGVVAGFTDTEGRFLFPALADDTYAVLAVYGDARVLTRDIAVKDGATVTIEPILDVGTEVVTIHEAAPMASRATVVKSTVKRRLPYTDEAILSDAWAVGWLLLDIDEAGGVTAFRFLRRPPRGLDEIARKEAWKLRFKPARDINGDPVASQLLWKMEWPSRSWQGMFAAFFYGYGAGSVGGVGTGIQPAQALARAVARRRIGYNGEGFLLPTKPALPPCQGSGPLSLDSHFHGYRDCSPPDLEGSMNEPLIRRDTKQ